MTVSSSQRSGGGYLSRPAPSGLADVIEIILDKGIVIDAYVRVSLVGIELLTIDARIVIASVDTYLRFAEATNRLDLYQHGGKDLTDWTAFANTKYGKCVCLGVYLWQLFSLLWVHVGDHSPSRGDWTSLRPFPNEE